MGNKLIKFDDAWGDQIVIDLEGSYLPQKDTVSIALIENDTSIALDLRTIKDLRNALDITEGLINKQLKEEN